MPDPISPRRPVAPPLDLSDDLTSHDELRLKELLTPRSEMPPISIAVFDTFERPKTGGTAHGVDVQHVVETNAFATSAEIRPFPIETETDLFAAGVPLADRVAERATSFLDATSAQLETLLAERQQVRVINQSMSQSPIRVVDDLLRKALTTGEDGPTLTPTGQTLATELGLEAEVTPAAFVQALVDFTSLQFREHPRVVEARARYESLSAELEGAGVIHVVTAGNTGRRVRELTELGVRFDEAFTASVLTTPHKLVIAASSGGPDEKITDFSTPGDHVSLAIDGEQIAVTGGRRLNGTSFSAPQVTATLADMIRLNPALTTDQLRELIRRASVDTAASTSEEGAGVLDDAVARELALVWR